MNANATLRTVGGVMFTLAIAGGGVIAITDVLEWGWNLAAVFALIFVGFAFLVAGQEPAESAPGADDLDNDAWEGE